MRTLLLVDDDPEDLAALASLVINAGYEAVAAQSAREALHYLTSRNPEPVAIVTDLSMPDMSGREFIAILQAYVRLSLIPIVVVSGVDTPPIEGIELLKKPLDGEVFLATLSRAIEKRVAGLSYKLNAADLLPPPVLPD